MKVLIVLVFTALNLYACDLRSPNNRQTSGNEVVILSPPPKTDNCKNYRHKSEAEIGSWPLSRQIDELIKEQRCHKIDIHDEYSSLVFKYVRKDGVNALPILGRHMDSYYPKHDDRVEEHTKPFFAVSVIADDLDNRVVRLRGTKEGRLIIEALDRGIERMRKVGFSRDWLENLVQFSKNQKGTNIIDNYISNSLREYHKIDMTDDEQLQFSNFLVSLDPTYPSWSELGEDGPPATLKESRRYYEAYLEFQKRNKR